MHVLEHPGQRSKKAPQAGIWQLVQPFLWLPAKRRGSKANNEPSLLILANTWGCSAGLLRAYTSTFVTDFKNKRACGVAGCHTAFLSQ